jgi:outer membrane protein assembly factor BamB
MDWRGLKSLAFWKKEAPRTRMQRLQKTMSDLWKKAREAWKSLWTNHRPATIAVIAGIVLLVALAGYLILKRPGDKSCPDPCTLEGTTEQKPIVGIADWPFYGLTPERTRYMNAPAVKPPFSVDWRFKGRNLLEYSPILVGGSLYAVNNNGLAFAVKTRSGKARWKHQVATSNASSPAYSDGLIYIVSLEPGEIQALYQANGKSAWHRTLPGRSESSPVVVGKKVIAGCECDTLFAFDKSTGRVLWQTHTPGEVKAAPAVSDGVAYVGDYSGTMSAINIADGSIKWQTGSQGASFGRAGSFYGTAAVAFGRVFATSKDGRVYSFDQDTGKLDWSQSAGGEQYAGVVAADTPNTDPTVYFGSYGDSKFYALDARTGNERWTADAGGPVIGAASLIGEVVYVANLQTTETYGFDAATGKRVFVFPDGAYNPVISDGKRIYLTGYKTIYALKPGTGAAVNGLIPKANPKAQGAKAKKGKKAQKKGG